MKALRRFSEVTQLIGDKTSNENRDSETKLSILHPFPHPHPTPSCCTVQTPALFVHKTNPQILTMLQRWAVPSAMCPSFYTNLPTCRNEYHLQLFKYISKQLSDHDSLPQYNRLSSTSSLYSAIPSQAECRAGSPHLCHCPRWGKLVAEPGDTPSSSSRERREKPLSGAEALAWPVRTTQDGVEGEAWSKLSRQ